MIDGSGRCTQLKIGRGNLELIDSALFVLNNLMKVRILPFAHLYKWFDLIKSNHCYVLYSTNTSQLMGIFLISKFCYLSNFCFNLNCEMQFHLMLLLLLYLKDDKGKLIWKQNRKIWKSTSKSFQNFYKEMLLHRLPMM